MAYIRDVGITVEGPIYLGWGWGRGEEEEMSVFLGKDSQGWKLEGKDTGMTG